MVFVPKNQRMDQYQAERGDFHALWEWKCDGDLAARWPPKAFCIGQGWDWKSTVATYHRKGIGLPTAKILVSDTWKNPAVPVHPTKVFTGPVLVFRVHLREKMSQYLGFVRAEVIADIQPVNYAFKAEHRNMRRLVLDHHLEFGHPEDPVPRSVDTSCPDVNNAANDQDPDIRRLFAGDTG